MNITAYKCDLCNKVIFDTKDVYVSIEVDSFLASVVIARRGCNAMRASRLDFCSRECLIEYIEGKEQEDG